MQKLSCLMAALTCLVGLNARASVEIRYDCRDTARNITAQISQDKGQFVVDLKLWSEAYPAVPAKRILTPRGQPAFLGKIDGGTVLIIPANGSIVITSDQGQSWNYPLYCQSYP